MKNEEMVEKIHDILYKEAHNISMSKQTTKEKLEKVSEIVNLHKILDNYEELEPVLIKFFDEKYKKEKWNKER